MREKLQKFMVGRYGIDDFSKFLFKCYLFFLFVDLFLDSFLFPLCELLLGSVLVFRTFSKNTYNRVKENRQYKQIYGKIKSFIFETKKAFTMKKTHIYKRCPKCKVLLKLKIPKTRGIKHTTCPDCKKRFAFFCFRKQK